MAKEYYQILGIPRDASEDEIKKAYRKLAMQYHPDRNPGKEKWANDKFKEINQAFSVLGDPQKRGRYDQFGTADGINTGDVFSSPFTRGTFEDLMKDFSGARLRFDFLDDIFGDFLRGKGFSFKRFRGAGGIRFKNRPGGRINIEEMFRQVQKAQPIRYKLTISGEETTIGTRRILSRKGKRLEVKIPPGVRSGSVIKLSNALQLTDGRPGDILIQIRIKD